MQNSKEQTSTKSKKANKRRNSRKKSLSPSNSIVTNQSILNGKPNEATGNKPECKRSLSEGSAKPKHNRKSSLKRTFSHPSTDTIPIKDEAKKDLECANNAPQDVPDNFQAFDIRLDFERSDQITASENAVSLKCEPEVENASDNSALTRSQVSKRKQNKNSKAITPKLTNNCPSVNDSDIKNSLVDEVNVRTAVLPDVERVENKAITENKNEEVETERITHEFVVKPFPSSISMHKDAIEMLNEEIQARFKEGIKSFTDQLTAAATLKPGYINAELTRIFQEQSREPMIKFARQHISQELGNELENLPGTAVRRVPVKRRRRISEMGKLKTIYYFYLP